MELQEIIKVIKDKITKCESSKDKINFIKTIRDFTNLELTFAFDEYKKEKEKTN